MSNPEFQKPAVKSQVALNVAGNLVNAGADHASAISILAAAMGVIGKVYRLTPEQMAVAARESVGIAVMAYNDTTVEMMPAPPDLANTPTVGSA